MTAPSSSRMRCDLALSMGDTDGDQPSLLSFTEPSTVTVNEWMKIPLTLSIAEVNRSVNLATYFSTVNWIAIVDKGGTGVLAGTASGTSGRDKVGANKVKIVGWDTTQTPPTIYIDNASASLAGYCEILAFGTQT